MLLNGLLTGLNILIQYTLLLKIWGQIFWKYIDRPTFILVNRWKKTVLYFLLYFWSFQTIQFWSDSLQFLCRDSPLMCFNVNFSTSSHTSSYWVGHTVSKVKKKKEVKKVLKRVYKLWQFKPPQWPSCHCQLLGNLLKEQCILAASKERNNNTHSQPNGSPATSARKWKWDFALLL